jgi:hypothetical protein
MAVMDLRSPLPERRTIRVDNAERQSRRYLGSSAATQFYLGQSRVKNAAGLCSVDRRGIRFISGDSNEGTAPAGTPAKKPGEIRALVCCTRLGGAAEANALRDLAERLGHATLDWLGAFGRDLLGKCREFFGLL